MLNIGFDGLLAECKEEVGAGYGILFQFIEGQ